MQLQPPDGLRAGTWDELYLLIKQYVDLQDYAVTTYGRESGKVGVLVVDGRVA